MTKKIKQIEPMETINDYTGKLFWMVAEEDDGTETAMAVAAYYDNYSKVFRANRLLMFDVCGNRTHFESTGSYVARYYYFDFDFT